MSPSSNQKITLPTLGHYNIQKVKNISEYQRGMLINFEKEVYDRHLRYLDTNSQNVFKIQRRYNDEIDRKIHYYQSKYYIASKGYDITGRKQLPQRP
jgi:hypothetical protein